MTAENGFPNYKDHPVKKAEDPRPYGDKPDPDHKMSEPGAAGAPPRIELFQNPPQTILNQPEEMTAPGEWIDDVSVHDVGVGDEEMQADHEASKSKPTPHFNDVFEEHETAVIIATAGDDPARWALQFCALMERQNLTAPPVPFVTGWFAEAMKAKAREPNHERERVSYESGYEAGVADERGAHEAKASQGLKQQALQEAFVPGAPLTQYELGRLLAVSWSNVEGIPVEHLAGFREWPPAWSDEHKAAVRAYMGARA